MNKINGNWVVKIEENEVERFITFCGAMDYPVNPGLAAQRTMFTNNSIHSKKEYCGVVSYSWSKKSVRRVGNIVADMLDCNPKHRFSSLDNFINFHFRK